MKSQRFVCKKCGITFEKEVFEPGEAEDKRVQAYPVHCPKCGSQNVEKK